MSLGLSQITNDSNGTISQLKEYGHLFDKWFITVADKNKKAYSHLASWAKDEGTDKLVLSYYKWNDDFASARNANLETIDTDYWFWIDVGDEIVNPHRLQDIVSFMQQTKTEVVQLKYDYAQDESGNGISDHQRERVINRAYDGEWHAPVHETFQGPPALVEPSDWVVVKQTKPQSEIKASQVRNEKILRKHWAETKDPRDAQYLGMTELSRGNDEQAIAWFLEHIGKSGSKQDIYRSWCRIAETEWKRQNFDQALYATDEAIKLIPEFPDAYHIKVILYTNMEEYDKGIEWLKVALSKPVPETLNVIDPTLYKYRGLAMGAQCFLFSGKVKEAFKLYQEVKEIAPEFWASMKKHDGINWDDLFTSAYYDQKAIDNAKLLLYYTAGTGGKPEKVFESLPATIFADVRLNPERSKFLKPKTWGDKEITIYCGQAFEPWGPDTLDKGMGGSEEAIVYLSRELSKLGWGVTVYNDREEELVDSGVTYLPWTLFNPQDQFNILVAWRNPSFARAVGAKAKKFVVDMHDVPGKLAKADIEKNNLFFVKSEYHASLLENVPKEKIVVIGNGISKDHFDTSAIGSGVGF